MDCEVLGRATTLCLEDWRERWSSILLSSEGVELNAASSYNKQRQCGISLWVICYIILQFELEVKHLGTDHYAYCLSWSVTFIVHPISSSYSWYHMASLGTVWLEWDIRILVDTSLKCGTYVHTHPPHQVRVLRLLHRPSTNVYKLVSTQ